MPFSQFLYRVQVACGISAKVILATLQKEQGLVTSRAPSDWALRAAMGMACPDTAPCDSAYAGLATQVYKGTAQLKTYKAGRFAKQPGYQYIQYSPNSACGGTNITVRNYATAALYSYTPYQPNAAALANLSGTGDGCSSYGNRNFWKYFNDWFGSVDGLQYMVSTADLDYLITRDSANELWAYPVNAGGGWGLRTSLGTGWGGADVVMGVGDLDENGYRDIIARDDAGKSWFYPGSAQLAYPTRKALRVDWSQATKVIYGGYFDAGYDPDVLTVDASGDLWLWPGDGVGDFLAAVKVGSGFGAYSVLTGVGDFTGEGCGDLLGVAASGDLMLFAGNCSGALAAPVKIGTAFGGYTGLYVAGDFTGDSGVDLWAKDPAGVMHLFRGTGGGAIANTTVTDHGWNEMSIISGAGMKPRRPSVITSVSSTDDMFAGYLIMRDSGNKLWAYPSNAAGGWAPRVSLGAGWAGANEIVGVGDLDGNGFRDLIARDTAGKVWFYAGDGRMDYPLRRAVAVDWSAARLILFGGYFDGNAAPDMLTVDAAGDLWLWPGTGSGQFGAGVKIGSGFAESSVTGVGDFDGDRCGDLVAVSPAGAMSLYRSDCAGGLQAPVQIGSGFAAGTVVYAAGDFSDDGVPDLWVRNGNTGRLFLGTGGGQIESTSVVEVGWNSMLTVTSDGMAPDAPRP
jgi:hypothetical protein